MLQGINALNTFVKMDDHDSFELFYNDTIKWVVRCACAMEPHFRAQRKMTILLWNKGRGVVWWKVGGRNIGICVNDKCSEAATV